MKIKELKEEHPAIYKRALECQVEQGNEPNDDLLLPWSKRVGNFNWWETIEQDIFWDSINNGKFQVFYERYPEHSKQPVNVEEKDWSKSPYELLKKCEMDYPHGTDALFGRCKRPGKVSWPLKFVECQGVSDNDRNMVFTFEYGFAEIVSQPQLNGKVPFVSMDECEVEFRTIGELAPEPKAGDMVEVSNDGEHYTGLFYFTGGKTALGAYVVSSNCGLDTFIRIRLPQKSEVESKANDLSQQWYHLSGDGKTNMIELFKQAIKWGQQNPNAK